MSAYRTSAVAESELGCPCCPGERLRIVAIGDAEVLACGACRGVLVSPAVMQRMLDEHDPMAHAILEQPAAPLRARPTGRALRCPSCNWPMVERRFAIGVEIFVDECVAHGIWFELGELRAVGELVASGDMMRALLAEASERARALAEVGRKSQAASRVPHAQLWAQAASDTVAALRPLGRIVTAISRALSRLV